ncbi:ribonuclease R family protein [Campylobacter sp.]|uniref:ribonuclease R family protein n=1 Tax=Campylobacter sp. TaxID=205 RepID=UPI002A570D6A|nr:ribonuclease R family protein [Campylobacter sp.]MDD7090048.1 ribonuclease R [Campylobacteraceae bacterium]MDY5284460.1 ribonuclease R family protein [Campylobacter sp.]
MRYFLETLSRGASKPNAKCKEALRILEFLKVISFHKGKAYLNNGFITGRLDINARGVGFIEVFSDKPMRDIVVESKNLGGAHLGDIVVAHLLSNKKSRQSAKILAVLEPANETSLVYLKRFGGAVLGVNIQNGLSLALKASQKSLKALPLGTLLKINNANNEITEVLGLITDPNIDEKISLAIYNKKDEFTPACKDEARAWGDAVDPSMYKERVDLQHLPFCTIDPDDAKDFDDAIYYDTSKNALYVAIADVSEYVSVFSATDKEAKNRCFSIYFPHKSVPMLPRTLSENICSLRPDEPRLAFTFKISLNDDLSVKKEELFSAIIKSKKRFTYNEVDKILENKSGCEQGILDWLLPLHKITQRLKQIRLKKGFDFRSKELKMSLNDDGLIASTHFESETPSHALIEDCMLLANKAAAKMISKGVFRNHAPADIKKISFLLDDLAALGIEAQYESDLTAMIAKIQSKANELGIREDADKLIIKAQKRAEYSHTSSGHFGLGFETYTHFTSPIRRYSDLILHRLLKAQLAKDDKLYNYLLEGIEATCEELNIKEREADKVAFDFMDRKFARWAEQNIGKDFICYISEISEPLIARLDDELKGARIILPNFTCPLLSRVRVRIISSDIASAKIIGKVVEKLDV